MKSFYTLTLALLLLCSCSGKASNNSKNIEELGFIRDLQLENNKYVILAKTHEGFILIHGEYDKVINPYIYYYNTYKYSSEFSSRASGFEKYKNHKYDNDLIAVMKNKVWGFISIKENGVEKIPFSYEDVHPFKDDFAAVKISGKWGFIDKNNNLVIKPLFDKVQDFFNGICIVEIKQDDKEFIAAIDVSGNYKFKIEKNNPIKMVYDFYEKDIAKAIDEKYGYYAINSDGKIVIESICNIGDKGGPIDPFLKFDADSGLCKIIFFNRSVYENLVKKNVLNAIFYGAFDKTGQWLIKPIYKTFEEVLNIEIQYFHDNAIIPIKDTESKKYGYKNNKGKWLIKPQYDYATTFNNGYAIVIINKKEGIINSDSKLKVDAKYDSLHHINGNYYYAELGNKKGVILANGKIVVPIIYDEIGVYEKDLPLYVVQDNLKGFIDNKGKWIIYADDKSEFQGYKNGIAFKYIEEQVDNLPILHHKFRVKLFLPDGTEIFTDKQFFEIYEDTGC